MSENDPTQPMEPQFHPPPPAWEYQVELSLAAGVNVYLNHKQELVVLIDGKWRVFDPETQMYMVDGDLVPLRGGDD